MKDLQVWEFVRKRLQRGAPVALLAVLHHEGSSPGRQGFKMAVRISGEMCGSIGGGIMEHKLVELAKNMLAENQTKPVLKHQIHSKLAAQNQSGMICSGHQSVGIYPLQVADLPEVDKIITAIKNRKKGVLQLIEKGVSFFPEMHQPVRYGFSSQKPTVWQYTEVLPERDTVYIVGAGHVALAFSKVMSLLDFDLHLFDDREGLDTFEQNQIVHFKTLTPFSKLAALIPEDEQSYVVIMTFGYRSDKEALKQLAGKKFKYLGLMGSKTKVDQLFSELRDEGFTEETLQKVFSPIGLQIKSETPEEIAISVAAQIIQIKNG
ncbi:XdhC family protein [Adhaeribacter sp. BT258]|uniref:XdhC family protein n=1 Tax=Adhaeribacter terrigena TaxID=2793070 RepID=A0ABS1BYN5_9BACT|nr:XdhC/CoxI family protein [Adhaeribacter terrigena]MBK0402036.1 XdhC family protein [Adhaeribacter terrigena]